MRTINGAIEIFLPIYLLTRWRVWSISCRFKNYLAGSKGVSPPPAVRPGYDVNYRSGNNSLVEWQKMIRTLRPACMWYLGQVILKCSSKQWHQFPKFATCASQRAVMLNLVLVLACWILVVVLVLGGPVLEKSLIVLLPNWIINLTDLDRHAPILSEVLTYLFILLACNLIVSTSTIVTDWSSVFTVNSDVHCAALYRITHCYC